MQRQTHGEECCGYAGESGLISLDEPGGLGPSGILRGHSDCMVASPLPSKVLSTGIGRSIHLEAAVCEIGSNLELRITYLGNEGFSNSGQARLQRIGCGKVGGIRCPGYIDVAG